MKAVLRFGARRKWCAPPDFDPVPSSEPLKDILLPFDMERLVAASEEADADLWLFGAVYGHHLSEVVRITGRDVDLRYNRLTVRMKSRRNSVVLRRVRLVPRLLPMFKRLVSKLKDLSEPLFRRLDGSPLGGPSGTQASAYVRRRLQICLVTANVVPPTGTFTHRSFRTTMATWMISASGGAMLFVMRYGGWRTLRMVEGYSADQDPEIVPDVLKFLGLPPATDIVSWMKLPSTSPSHGGVPGLH